MTYILMIVGFALLIKGADMLVDGSASIAKRLNISSLVIGLTIVAFGTSAPELAVNLFASLQGNADIAIGNIIGSNIANILLILGISATIYPLTVKGPTIWKEIPLSLLAAVLVAVMANDMFLDGAVSSLISRSEGLILISFFIIFLYYTFGLAKGSENTESDDLEVMSTLRSGLYIVIGLTGLVLGGKWIVDGAIDLAALFGMSQSVIALTVVAVGTSLPELATSAIAAYKRQTDIAIGNVVGSNIFNVFWILGLSATITPLPFSQVNNFDIGWAVLATVFLFLCLFVGKRHVVERWQGVTFIALYLAYTLMLVL